MHQLPGASPSIHTDESASEECLRVGCGLVESSSQRGQHLKTSTHFPTPGSPKSKSLIFREHSVLFATGLASLRVPEFPQKLCLKSILFSSQATLFQKIEFPYKDYVKSYKIYKLTPSKKYISYC